MTMIHPFFQYSNIMANFDQRYVFAAHATYYINDMKFYFNSPQIIKLSYTYAHTHTHTRTKHVMPCMFMHHANHAAQTACVLHCEEVWCVHSMSFQRRQTLPELYILLLLLPRTQPGAYTFMRARCMHS